MNRQCLLSVVIVSLACGLIALAQPADEKVYLLHVTDGQLPPDTGLDGKTTPVIVDAYEPLGGKALQVAFAAGDSIGGRLTRHASWKPFSHLRFDAVNPGKQPVKLDLNLIHAGTKNYDTRTVVPLTFQPGRNKIRLDLAELKNVNGSAPELGKMVRWYLADAERKGPTLYFGDIWLKRIEASAEAGDRPPLVGYKIRGRVGNLPVDLTVTPFYVGGGKSDGTSQSKVHGDPARLERIKAATMPEIDKPILFNTPEADAVCSALEVFPADNPWNLVVADWPVHANSKNIIASIGADKPFRYNPDMGFVLVPPDQKKVDVKITAYPGESDKGPFPVPANVPIEGWPVHYPKQTLEQVQRKVEEGDRHALVVDPVNRKLYEFYQLRKTDAGWQAAQSSVFDLTSNKLRPDGWTSSDAAGLPVFPAVVRYDELKRGMVEHALRVTVRRSRRAYVYPATHFASRLTDENLPRMGERIRLKADFDIKPFSPEVQAILKGLKKYGMLVADNGIDWAVSVAPDPRIKPLHDELRKLKGADFEVVTFPEGYRPPR